MAPAIPVFADKQKGFDSLADEINISLQLRPRYEYVTVDESKKDEANALTVRTSFGLGFTNLFKIKGLKTYIETTDVSNFGLLNDYDSTSKTGGNDKPEYEAVIDPPITRITQAYASYTYNISAVGFGRRILNLDNQRFIGAVGWRQMSQTFGVADLTLNPNKKTILYTAYVYERKGIKDELSKDYEGAKGSVLINASYILMPVAKATSYAYLLRDKHNSYGLRLTGQYGISPLKFNYVLEGALQKNSSLGEGEADSYYYNIEAGLNHKGFILKGNYEVLGEAENNAPTGFSTPWATLHAFNGWSDVLAGKAANGDSNGLKDAYGTVGYDGKKYGKFLFVFHKFDSVKESLDYGKEYDLQYVKMIKGVKFLAKAAFYEADNFGKDTTKFWLMAVYNFKKIFK